jgi:hypothetical protein
MAGFLREHWQLAAYLAHLRFHRPLRVLHFHVDVPVVF